MRDSNKIYEAFLIFSIILFRSYLFSYPKVLIRFFIERNNSEFFVSDLNFFTYRYAYRNCFRIYLRYVPFVHLFLLVWLKKFCFKETYSKWARFLAMSLYAHIVTICYNHYDFSNRIHIIYNSFFDSQLNRLEFSYVLLQYSGAYWDFLCTLFVYYGVTIYFRENCVLSQVLCYEITYFFLSKEAKFTLKKTIDFWPIMHYVWFFRLFSFFISVYFFCGEGMISDTLVRLISVLSIECILFSFRFFCILKTYK
jgi:hypothetical protein